MEIEEIRHAPWTCRWIANRRTCTTPWDLSATLARRPHARVGGDKSLTVSLSTTRTYIEAPNGAFRWDQASAWFGGQSLYDGSQTLQAGEQQSEIR